MARVQSPVWNIIRGSIAGTTYLANQFHQIIARARTAPVQPNTAAQAIVRSSMTAGADGWNALSDGEQNAWESYADQTPFPGPLGPYTVTGRDIYLAMKMMRTFIDLSGLAAPSGAETAPGPFSGFYNLKNVAATTFVTASETGVAITMTSEKDFDCIPLVQISGPFLPARKRYKGPWINASNQATILIKDTSVIVTFVGLVEDARYFMRVKAVSDGAPGRISPEFIVNSIAVTNGP